LIVFVALPFIISRLWAKYLIRRLGRAIAETQQEDSDLMRGAERMAREIERKNRGEDQID